MRCAAIDVGTNSVLLLVAERSPEGTWRAVEERAEITRLGRGVDRTRELSEASREDTLRVLETYAAEARRLGAREIVATATSAARDATNGARFLEEVHARTGLTLEILPGDEEARLSFASVSRDPAFSSGPGALVVIDIGGGSTEVAYGGTGEARDTITWRHSFDVGSVRLTERYVKTDPPTAEERAAVETFLAETWKTLPAPPPGARVVGVAGTMTTLFAVANEVEPYDSVRVHGGELGRETLRTLGDRLFQLSLEERRKLPGLQPKRADVLPQGALILATVLDRLGVTRCWVSDRGLRWGLLADRFPVRVPRPGNG